jgi:hypothetical protein
MVTNTTNRPLHAAIMHLLRPLVRILLNHGVAYDTFSDMAKWVYMDVAMREFGLPNRKQTDSRVSVLTGLTRKEVARLKETPTPTDTGSANEYHRAAKVVSGWVHDYPRKGSPSGAAPLPMDGVASFSELVRRHSGDMPVRAMLDELLRVGAVRRNENNDIELVHRHYLPPQGEARKLVYLGDDTSDLISTIAHNLDASQSETFLQRKVFYDNIPLGRLAEVRKAARKFGEPVLEQISTEFAKHDRDSNPSLTGEGRARAVVGIYYYEEPIMDETDQPR